MLSPLWCLHLFISAGAARLEALGSGLFPRANATTPRHRATSRPTASLCSPSSAHPVGPAWKLNAELAGSCLLLAVRIKIKLPPPPPSHTSAAVPVWWSRRARLLLGTPSRPSLQGRPLQPAGGRGMGSTSSVFPLPFGGPKPRSLKPFLTPRPQGRLPG